MPTAARLRNPRLACRDHLLPDCSDARLELPRVAPGSLTVTVRVRLSGAHSRRLLLNLPRCPIRRGALVLRFRLKGLSPTFLGFVTSKNTPRSILLGRSPSFPVPPTTKAGSVPTLRSPDFRGLRTYGGAMVCTGLSIVNTFKPLKISLSICNNLGISLWESRCPTGNEDPYPPDRSAPRRGARRPVWSPPGRRSLCTRPARQRRSSVSGW